MEVLFVCYSTNVLDSTKPSLKQMFLNDLYDDWSIFLPKRWLVYFLAINECYLLWWLGHFLAINQCYLLWIILHLMYFLAINQCYLLWWLGHSIAINQCYLLALNYITSDVFSCYKFELFAMIYIVTAKLVLFVMYFLVRSSTMWVELF